MTTKLRVLHVPIRISVGKPHAEDECRDGCTGAPRGATGPAKVTSDQYRAGWEALFGRRKEVGQA